jgi:IS1 family transposase
MDVPRRVIVPPKPSYRLIIECDEAWSFVGNKEEKQLVWIAKDRENKYVVGVYIGSRGIDGAKGLWNSLPLEYRERAICYTDFWESYESVFPKDRHHSVGKESGQTNHVERFYCTMRQRISRLVRKTLSFSKKIENHIGAIWNFVHHYNYEIYRQSFA